jgi:hypothetical protein
MGLPPSGIYWGCSWRICNWTCVTLLMFCCWFMKLCNPTKYWVAICCIPQIMFINDPTWRRRQHSCWGGKLTAKKLSNINNFALKFNVLYQNESGLSAMESWLVDDLIKYSICTFANCFIVCYCSEHTTIAIIVIRKKNAKLRVIKK